MNNVNNNVSYDITFHICELFELMSTSNHWLIREKMKMYRIEANGAMHVFYEKQREFSDAEGKCLKIDAKLRDGYTYVAPHRQVENKEATANGDDRCDIYAFVNYYQPKHPEHKDVVESLICNFGGEEFTITPSYSDVMYTEIFTKSKLKETPGTLFFPEASLTISY